MPSPGIASPRAPGNGPGWTDTRTERLKALWAEGRSASEIAGLLGEVTRNAVIGKVHRLNLAGRKTTSRQPVPRRTSPRRHRSGRVELRLPPSRFVRAASPLPPSPPPPVAARMLPLRQLRDDQCRCRPAIPAKPVSASAGARRRPAFPIASTTRPLRITRPPAAGGPHELSSGSRTLWRRHWRPGASLYRPRRARGRVPGGVELRALRPPAFVDGRLVAPVAGSVAARIMRFDAFGAIVFVILATLFVLVAGPMMDQCRPGF